LPDSDCSLRALTTGTKNWSSTKKQTNEMFKRNLSGLEKSLRKALYPPTYVGNVMAHDNVREGEVSPSLTYVGNVMAHDNV